MRIAPSSVLIVMVGCALLAWNGSRFVGAQPKVRTKDLTFLPAPAVAKAMTLGHDNTVAKLRWIDSFAYFELQLDRKDDTVSASGESAFERLYRMLLALDPHFLPYYQHLSLNLGGVVGKHSQVLPLLQGGLLELPHDTDLWRLIATELQTVYHLEDRNPRAMDAFLTSWHDAELTPIQQQQVWDWKKAIGRRQYQGLEQLAYWQEQLSATAPGTPAREFVINTMREQVARFGEEQLGALLTAWRKLRPVGPTSVADLLQPDCLRAAIPHGIPPYAPLYDDGGTLRLRPDPFGYEYALLGGAVISPGWQLHRAIQRGALMSARLATLASTTGSWPKTLAEAQMLGLQLDELPARCQWQLIGQEIRVIADPPPHAAWDPVRR